MREKSIDTAVLDFLKDRPGVSYRKNHGGRFGKSGYPDIEAVFRPLTRSCSCKDAGRVVGRIATIAYVECKRPGESPTPQQAARIKELRAAGAPVVVARTFADAVDFLNGLGIPGKKK